MEADSQTRTATLQVDPAKFNANDAIAKLAEAGYANSTVATTTLSLQGDKPAGEKPDESKSETN